MNFTTRLCPLPLPSFPNPMIGANEWSLARKEAHTASKIALAQAYREFHQLSAPSKREEIQAALSQSNLDWFWQHSSQLEEQHYFQLRQQTDLLCSRSHTKFLAAGAIAALGLGLYSIGIDLEAMNRKIQPEIRKFFLNDDEPELFGPPHLAIWVTKEAAFKAVSSYLLNQTGQLESSLTLKSIQLKAHSPTEGEFHWREKYRGFYKIISFRPHDLGDHLLAEASLTQVP